MITKKQAVRRTGSGSGIEHTKANNQFSQFVVHKKKFRTGVFAAPSDFEFVVCTTKLNANLTANERLLAEQVLRRITATDSFFTKTEVFDDMITGRRCRKVRRSEIVAMPPAGPYEISIEANLGTFLDDLFKAQRGKNVNIAGVEFVVQSYMFSYAGGAVLPAVGPLALLTPDVNKLEPGVQLATSVIVSSPILVDIIARDIPDPGLASFSFELDYDPFVLSAGPPTLGPGLGSTGNTIVCGPPSPAADLGVRPPFASAFMTCDVDVPVPPYSGPIEEMVIATIPFTALSPGVSPLTFDLDASGEVDTENIAFGDSDRAAITPIGLSNASITVILEPVVVGGIAEVPEIADADAAARASDDSGAPIALYAIAGGVAAAVAAAGAGAWLARRRRAA